MPNQHFFVVLQTPPCRFLKYSSQWNRRNNCEADRMLHPLRSEGARWNQCGMLRISLNSRKMARFGPQSLSRYLSASERSQNGRTERPASIRVIWPQEEPTPGVIDRELSSSIPGKRNPPGHSTLFAKRTSLSIVHTATHFFSKTGSRGYPTRFRGRMNE